jgi:hypothetical protein
LCLGLNILWAACILGPFTGSIWGFLAAASLRLTTVPAAILCQRLRRPFRGAAFTPFVLAALFHAVLNSTVVKLRQKAFDGRIPFYPLEMLRAGNAGSQRS